MSDNTRVLLREYLESRLDALEKKMEARFDALDDRLEQVADHEARIRAVEKASPLRTIVEAITAIVATIGVILGFNKP